MIHSIKLQPFGDSRVATLRTISAFLCGTVAIAVLQDFFSTVRNDSSFYLSESLLFKVFWIFFVPLGYCAWWAVRALVSEKDGRFDVLRKIAIAISIAIPLHALLFSLSVSILSALFFDHVYSVIGNLTYTLTNDGLLYVFVYGGVGVLIFYSEIAREMALILPLKEAERVKNHALPSQPREPPTARHILVGTSKHRVVVPFDDILCISSSAPYIAIQTRQKEYLHAETLKSLHQILPQTQFVRIHKSTIVNIREIVSYTSRLNGDYDILLTNRQEVRLSRNYAKEFREAFEARTPRTLAQSS